MEDIAIVTETTAASSQEIAATDLSQVEDMKNITYDEITHQLDDHLRKYQ